MRTHVKILFLTVVVIAIETIISYFYFKNKWNETSEFNVYIYFIVLVLWSCYPIGLYTCWRLIADEDYKGIFLYNFLMKPMTGCFAGVFFIPLILSPLFIPDYISYFKHDLKTHKRDNLNM